MSDLTPAEQRLADQLRRQASSLDLGDTAVATVVRRGQLRQERHKALVSVAAVVALSAIVIGSIQLLSRPTSHKIIASTDSEPTGETAPAATAPAETVADGIPRDDLTPVTRVDSSLTWNAVEPGTTQALGSSFWNTVGVSAQPPYLAWSTAPGKGQEFVPSLYRSDDGIHWTAAGGESFTQPQVSARGLGMRNGRMFAFGTAAATAPIAMGGGGDVVVDVSDDLGASWRNIVLPIDLRGLAASKGVQGVGFQGGMAANDSAVVAVGVPNLVFEPSVYSASSGGIAPTRNGAIAVPSAYCGNVTDPTVPVAGGYSAASTTTMVGEVPPDTAPAGTTPSESPTTIGYPGNAPDCTAISTPQSSAVTPWSDLGVDPAAVAAMFTPRVFVSIDGEHFTEGSFPGLPDGYQPGQFTVAATANGFAATMQLYNPNTGGGIAAKLYTSADGLSWTEADMPGGQYDSINFLPNGTIVGFANSLPGAPSSQSFTAVSTDGVTWSTMSMASLLDPADGKSAQLNVALASGGPAGVTAVATISSDAAEEAGGISVEKDGVRLTMTSFRYRTLVATDIATGDQIGSLDWRVAPTGDARLVDSSDGGVQVLSPDGTVRVTFDATMLQGLFSEQSANSSKNVILHSSDGINWSRDEVRPITGFETYGATRVQVTESNVLVSFVDSNSRDAKGIPKTVVLVGTPKS